MKKAALAVAGVVCILAGGAAGIAGDAVAEDPAADNNLAAGGSPAATARAFCFIEPREMDVRVNPGALVVRIELFSPDGLRPLSTAGISPGVYLASVGGTRLPVPGGGLEGIAEARGARSHEDRMDVRKRGPGANQAPELVIRFTQPSDGDPSTPEDGDAGDVLAMLTDVPDGRKAEICLAGSVGEAQFSCCDTVTIRNRGLRDLPSALRPGGPPAQP